MNIRPSAFFIFEILKGASCWSMYTNSCISSSLLVCVGLSKRTHVECNRVISTGIGGGATSRKVLGSISDGPLGFFIDLSFRPHYCTEVNSTSNRNEYQEYLLESKGGPCLWLTLPRACADFLGTLGVSASWSPNGLSRPVMELLCNNSNVCYKNFLCNIEYCL